MNMASGSEDVILAVKEISTLWTAKWRALLAGAMAGPSMLLTGFNTQHTSLAIYILMRTAVLASRCGIKRKRFGHICKALTWGHGDIFLMFLSSSQILQDLVANASSTLDTMLKGSHLIVISSFGLWTIFVMLINMIHGNQLCIGHFLSFLIQAYEITSPVYLHVYLIPALIVHRKGLLKRIWTCFHFRLFKRCNIPMVAKGTFPTGLALAIEKKSRRIVQLTRILNKVQRNSTCYAKCENSVVVLLRIRVMMYR